MSSGIIRKKLQAIFRRNGERPESEKMFSGSDEYLLKNDKQLLEERVSLFDGKTNPIRSFSADELNTMITGLYQEEKLQWYNGVLDGKTVLVSVVVEPWSGTCRNEAIRDIVVATEMSTHNNVLKLLGCCLETKNPVLICERPENGTLEQRIFGGGVFQLKDKLRIAWEISHAMAYLHTAFPRPIVYRDLKPHNVFLDKNNVAKLSDFSFSVSIPEGETLVEVEVIGTLGYIAPEYLRSGRVAESTDVYSFGVLFLALLTGKKPWEWVRDRDSNTDWITEGFKQEQISEIVDSAITKNREIMNEELQRQLQESLDLAIWCISREPDNRPTMVEIATQLKRIIRSSQSESVPSSSSSQ